MAMPKLEQTLPQRTVALLLALVAAVSAAGFLVGTSKHRLVGVSERGRAAGSADFPRTLVARAHGVLPALRYEQLAREGGGAMGRGVHAGWTSDPVQLAGDASPTATLARPGRSAPASAPEVAAALEARAALRAFDGAPPAVPHAIPQRGVVACLACHEQGLRLGDPAAGGLRAPSLPHAAFTNCTQCHVEAEGRPGRIAAAPPSPGLVASAFEGLPAPRAGERAYEGAPPVVPHSRHMRERCDGCHGPSGDPALQPAHVERASCGQCHAGSAALDQQP